MQPDAVAIRLPPIEVGPEEIRGKTPVVIFAEQGMTGAQLDSDLFERSMPARVDPAQKFQLEELVVVLDRSGSMNDPVEPHSEESKIDHVRRQLGRLGQSFLPETRISLVTLNSTAELIRVTDQGGIGALQAEVAKIVAGGKTNFEPALQAADARLQDHAATHPFARSAVIFITDGIDGGSRERAQKLAETIRDKNAGTFIVGVGSDYDLGNLFQLASNFGFSGWAHTPTPEGANVFRLLLPAVLADMQSAEHYLEVKASGSIAKMYGITPAIREAIDGVFYIGYQHQGVGICFVDDDAEFTLEVKSHAADKQGTIQAIPIIDVDAAGAHYEKLQMARASIGPLLVLLAQLNGDAPLLGQLQDAYPTLAPHIKPLLAQLKAGDAADQATRQDAHTSMGTLGTMMAEQMFTRVNPLSRVPRYPYQGPAGRPESPELHSGGLGPLSLDAGATLPPVQRADAAAYKDVAPRFPAKLLISGASVSTEYALDKLPVGQMIVAGRSPNCEIVLSDSNVSRGHFAISREPDGFYIEDLHSKNGTRVNGVKIDGKIKLADGDVIGVTDTTITFKLS